MSQFLVTGGAGFIGSHLVDALLAGGHTVRVLDDLSTGKEENLTGDVELVVGSITNRDLVGEVMKDCVGCFHLGAVASVERCNNDWAATHQVNLTGTIHVFEAASAAGRIPVVYASSAAIFGNAADLPLTETSPTFPRSAYGADKLGCEQHARAGHIVHGLPSTGLRFFNVYGPRQDPLSPYSGVISIFANRLATGRGVTIFGDGLQSRDFVYVSDIVKTLMQSMFVAADQARVFNVCTGTSKTLLDLVGALGTVLAIEPQVTFGPAREGDIKHSAGSPALMAKSLGFQPSIMLEDGLRAMFA